MSDYPEARFLTSANAVPQFVEDSGAEVAVAGTSKTPGRTQLVNFFSLAENQRLVDLPGYGFARVSDAKRRHWGELLTDYFQGRKSLKGLIQVVDIRRQLTDFDQDMLAFAESVGLPVHILLTKADKLKRGQRSKTVLEVRKALGDRASVQPFSALTRDGEVEARARLHEFLSRGD